MKSVSVPITSIHNTDLVKDFKFRKIIKMFRLVVLSAFFVVALATPGYYHSEPTYHQHESEIHEHIVEEPVTYEKTIVKPKYTIVEKPVTYEKHVVKPHFTVVEEPTVKHVGDIVKTYPSATSYQSQTQWHSEKVSEPIFKHGIKKTVVETPIIEKHLVAVPAVKKTIVSTPIVESYHHEHEGEHYEFDDGHHGQWEEQQSHFDW